MDSEFMSEVTASKDRFAQIAELAEIVADEYCPSGRVDPEVAVRKLGITLSYGSYRDYFDGLLEHLSGRFHIYCNLDRVEFRSSGRAHFTIAHELGHYFIDEHRNALAAGVVPSHPSFCEYESEFLVEREADHFAANLLMPEKRFRAACRKKEIGLTSILMLADLFGASVTSTALRYTQLDVVPCAVFKWTGRKLQWKWMSTETFRARFGSNVQLATDLPPDCPTVHAMRGEKGQQKPYFEAGTTVSTWFRRVSNSSYRNDILIEQAIPLGRFGVLTFLFPESGKYSP
jgi:Zn-dependent peptidase ImmA (M78 family)